MIEHFNKLLDAALAASNYGILTETDIVQQVFSLIIDNNEAYHTIFSEHIKTSNPFLDNVIKHSVPSDGRELVNVFFVLPNKKKTIQKLFVDVITNNNHPIPVRIPRRIEKTLNKQRRKSLYANSNVVYGVTADYSILSDLKDNGLAEYIIDIVPYSKKLDIRAFKKYVQDELFNGNTLRDEAIDKDPNDFTKPTKVMQNLYSEYKGISEDESRDILSNSAKEVINGDYIRINFRLTNSSTDCLSTLMKQFEQNNVVPLRLNWGTSNGKRVIVGGNVISPVDKYERYTSRLKLYGIKSLSMICSRKIILNQLRKLYA